MGIAQLVQKLPRRYQIGGAESLCESVVDRPKTGDGIGGTALLAQKPGEARRRSKLPRHRLLSPRSIQRLQLRVHH